MLRENQVWAMDITYIPMERGFVYLAVVLDWATRRVLSWRLSITMEVAFCVETLEDALARHGKPDIFNTDQGSQFTGTAFTSALADRGIAISMDGKGALRDNVFVERLWRSIKYEEVYLRAYDTLARRVSTQACRRLKGPMQFGLRNWWTLMTGLGAVAVSISIPIRSGAAFFMGLGIALIPR
jgi:putative transposase